ncbi:MAG: SURF1 family protein [Tatlockia sp.]|nr:SURF1 family protein [Tatlockia sp.]
MISLTCFNRRFTPNWRMTFLSFAALLFFSFLGFWQLDRAHEKKQMLAAQVKLAHEQPLAWKPTMPLPKQYQRVQLSGQYLQQTFLLDNQHHNHRFGYHVLTPLALDSGKILLVDKGWVAADPGRQLLPRIDNISAPRPLIGSVYYPSKKTWVLGQVLEKQGADVAIVERIDSKLIGQFLHKSVYPFIIRLDEDGSSGFIRDWPVVSMPPERHYGYALQWFSMAVVIIILFLALNLKKNNENEKI